MVVTLTGELQLDEARILGCSLKPVRLVRGYLVYQNNVEIFNVKAERVVTRQLR